MSDELKHGGFREFLLWLFRLRRRFRVTGNSMLPLLQPGETILVDPKAYRHASPRPGDIVVAQHPYRSNLHLVKRVVAEVENGRCLLAGDNPSESTDSRSFGAVDIEQILGRVTSRF